MLKIKITFQTRYNGCTVESSNQDVNKVLENAIPFITHELCEEDGEWYMPKITDDMDEEIRIIASDTLVDSYELEYEYDEYSS